VLEELNRQLADAQPLTEEQVREAVELLIDEKIPAAIKADFLTALAQKGETPGEICAFVLALRSRSIAPPLEAETREREILDVVGTGGDRHGTFNISTTTALVCAAAGVTVAKHGNRAVTSQAGSADVLEALGVQIALSPAEAARSLREHHFAFFFAPAYHPAFKHIAPARKLCAERGQRTVFNFLGTLLNPVHASAMLVGVAQPGLCEPLAQVLQSLGVRRAMVVCGRAGTAGYLDEFSTLGENTVAEFYQARGLAVSAMPPDFFPLQPARLADLLGGGKEQNAEIVRRILRGEECGPKRDAVLLNAAAALFVANQARSIADGWTLAAATLDSGKAAAKLVELGGVI